MQQVENATVVVDESNETLQLNELMDSTIISGTASQPDEFKATLFKKAMAGSSRQTVLKGNNAVERDAAYEKILNDADIAEAHRSIASLAIDDEKLEELQKVLLSYKEQIRLLEEILLEQQIRLESFQWKNNKTNFFTTLTTFATMKYSILPDCIFIDFIDSDEAKVDYTSCGQNIHLGTSKEQDKDFTLQT